jgi:hypothetical protein
VDNIANVFGEGTAIHADGHEIAYVAPQDVAERPHVRVLLAKDAISTGWDCPRAEVLMSFRPAADLTHITQLLGRMVRTPLARRIPGDDRLNAVECILPLFNRDAAQSVAAQLSGEAGGGGPDVVVESASFGPNPATAEAVWEVFDRLPSQTVPRAGSRPVSRFTALAAALARDKIRSGAYEEALDALVAFLRGKAVQYPREVEAQIADVREMAGERIATGLGAGPAQVIERFALVADDAAVEADYRVARRTLTPQLATAYADVLEAEHQDGYYEAHLRTAALARVPAIVEQLDVEADRLFAEWDARHRLAVKRLKDDRRDRYDSLRALAGEPVRVDIQRPSVRIEAIETLTGEPAATRPKHLLSDADGGFPVESLRPGERVVLDAELEHCVAWYRNPSRASADALSIAYRDSSDRWRRLCPDFIFFENVRGELRPSIVDPHGSFLSDAEAKLRGLAAYAAEYGAHFHRIEAVDRVDGHWRVLDLMRPDVRDAVADRSSAKELYASSLAGSYLPTH